jgi:hypothetical protein
MAKRQVTKWFVGRERFKDGSQLLVLSIECLVTEKTLTFVPGQESKNYIPCQFRSQFSPAVPWLHDTPQAALRAALKDKAESVTNLRLRLDSARADHFRLSTLLTLHRAKQAKAKAVKS